MPTFKPCGHDVSEIVDRMKEKYHGELQAHGVTIDCMFAYADFDKDGLKKGPPLKHAGFAALATIRIVNLRDRTAGMGDAQMLIDADAWEKLNDEEKDALIDHELEHLVLARNKRTGEVITDDLSRPKLRMRRHDVQFGWFTSVARRHGKASQEVKQATEFFNRNRQTYLPFEEEAAAAA